ncbi:ABC transporter permease [Chloroflexota bacterium]
MNILINIWVKLRLNLRGAPKIAIATLLVLTLAAVFADLLPLQNPEVAEPTIRNLPPFFQEEGSLEHPFGTDGLGRDGFSRFIYGARVSLIVAFMAVFVAGSVGTAIGIVSGFLGGTVDNVLMRITEGWLSFPTIFIAILMSVILGPGVQNIIIVLAAVYWTRYARIIRGEALTIKERDFIQLSRTSGASKARIMLRHILPNVINTAIVLSTLLLGQVVVMEATLSFIGVGVPPPKAAWGLMLSQGRDGMIAGYWWQTVFPGLGIVMLVMSANMLGDWLRVRLDPRLQQLL